VLPEQRVSDAERDRVARVLREAYADGRLSQDELAVRTQGALEARTDTELDALVADLDEPRPAWISPRTHAALFLGGSAAAWLTWFVTRVPDPGADGPGCRLLLARLADARLGRLSCRSHTCRSQAAHNELKAACSATGH
jgi:DUF1707 SHOCT-like domain